MSAHGTRATEALREAGIPFTLHEYGPVASGGAGRHDGTPSPPAGRSGGGAADRGRRSRPAYGFDAAAAIGVDRGRVFKTLVAAVDEVLVVAIVPVSTELDLKALAATAGGRRAAMAEPAVAERATGYVVGGISPFGLRRRLPILVDGSAFAHPTVFVSAGRRGLQLELAPGDLVRATGATVAPLGRS